MNDKNIKSLNEDIITVILEFKTKGKIRNTNVHHGVMHAFVSSEKGELKYLNYYFQHPLNLVSEMSFTDLTSVPSLWAVFSYVILSQLD